jgi:hypothetical protein
MKSANVGFMTCASPLFAALSMLALLSLPAVAGELTPSQAPASCHFGSGGSIVCTRISGYLSGGPRFVGASPPSPFETPAPGFANTSVDDAQREPEGSLGTTRLYIDGGGISR